MSNPNDDLTPPVPPPLRRRRKREETPPVRASKRIRRIPIRYVSSSSSEEESLDEGTVDYMSELSEEEDEGALFRETQGDEDEEDANGMLVDERTLLERMEQGVHLEFRERDGMSFSNLPTKAQSRSCAIARASLKPGPTTQARSSVSQEAPETSFSLFFDEEMRQKIIQSTNAYCSTRLIDWQPLTSTELLCFYGLLIIAGTLYSRWCDVEFLWNPMTGPSIFRASMSRRRFEQLLRYIRFEDGDYVTAARLRGDKISAVRWMWGLFVEKCELMFTPGQNLTLDKMISPFYGRSSVKTFNPSKPGKYGFHINLVCDTNSRYVATGRFHIPQKKGQPKQHPSAGFSVGGTSVTDQVMDILSSYFGSGRLVFMDRFFTAIDTAQRLLMNKLEIVGRIVGNRRGVPRELTHLAKGRFSVKRKTRRWTMSLHFTMVDIACLNAFTIYNALFPSSHLGTNRMEFLLEVGRRLCLPKVTARPLVGLRVSTVAAIKDVRGRAAVEGEHDWRVDQKKKQRCAVCKLSKSSSNSRQTRTECSGCGDPVCDEHSSFFCEECLFDGDE